MLNLMANSPSSFDPVHHILFPETFSSFGLQEAILLGFPPTRGHSFSFFFADSFSSSWSLNVTASQVLVLGLPFSSGHTNPLVILEAYNALNSLFLAPALSSPLHFH